MPKEPPEFFESVSNVSITPLRKRDLKGTLYSRDPLIEAKLHEILLLPHEEMDMRCGIQRRDDPSHIPSECLLYLVRACRTDEPNPRFEQLYKTLAKRILNGLPRAESADGEKLSLTKSLIREKAFDRFVEMLVRDRADYFERLDYFEVRFDDGLAKLRLDAQKKYWREERRSANLEIDHKTGDIAGAVESATGNFDPFDPFKLDASDYRSRLDAAIDALTPEHRRIVEMIRKDIPIDSKESGALTIAKALGKSEKTIRTHRDQAYAKLRVWLAKGGGL